MAAIFCDFSVMAAIQKDQQLVQALLAMPWKCVSVISK